MKSKLGAAAAATVLLSVAAGLGFADSATMAERHPFVYPQQKADLIFSHADHASDDKDCADCHEKAEAPSGRMSLPGHEACGECHEIEAAKQGEDTDPPADCKTCHGNGVTADTDLQPPLVVIPQTRLTFSHAIHADKGVKCLDCHSKATESKLLTVEDLPSMETCQNCHAKSGGKESCQACHTGDGKGRLLTLADGHAFKPTGTDRADRHTTDWETRHGLVAKENTADCLACHTESTCADCHASRNVLSIHPAGWIESHPARSEGRQFQCQSCHEAETFCSSCHRSHKLGRPGSGPDAPRTGQYHPSGWMDSTAGMDFHGPQARTQLANCASCHEENSCKACHGSRYGGRYGGVSPHPAGFDPDSARRAAPGSCKGCHLATDPKLK